MCENIAGHVSPDLIPGLSCKPVTLATTFASSQKVDFSPPLSGVYQDGWLCSAQRRKNEAASGIIIVIFLFFFPQVSKFYLFVLSWERSEIGDGEGPSISASCGWQQGWVRCMWAVTHTGTSTERSPRFDLILCDAILKWLIMSKQNLLPFVLGP
jgi:hypothetical protein